MSNIIPFSYQEKEIRVIEDQDGNPWWVAKDVCEVLGFGNTSQALKNHLDEDEKGIISHDTHGGKQELLTINESGLYTLILKDTGKKSGSGTPVQQLFFFESVREVMS